MTVQVISGGLVFLAVLAERVGGFAAGLMPGPAHLATA
jgi:hypothetical protein